MSRWGGKAAGIGMIGALALSLHTEKPAPASSAPLAFERMPLEQATPVILKLDPENSPEYNRAVRNAIKHVRQIDPASRYIVVAEQTLGAPLPSNVSRMLPILEDAVRYRDSTFTIIAQHGTFYVDSVACTTQACNDFVASSKPESGRRYLGMQYGSGAVVSVAERALPSEWEKQLALAIYHEDGHRRGAGHTLGTTPVSQQIVLDDPRTYHAYAPSTLEEIARREENPNYRSPLLAVPPLAHIHRNPEDRKALGQLNAGYAAFHENHDAAATISFAVGLSFAENPKLKEELNLSLSYMRRLRTPRTGQLR